MLSFLFHYVNLPKGELFVNLYVSTLIDWGRVTHICVSNLAIIGSDNCLSPGRRHAIIWTDAGILLIGPSETDFNEILNNKANLRDLIAATGLVISNWIQIFNFSTRVTVKFDWWPCKTIGHLFYATLSFVHHLVAIGEYKLELQSRNAHPIWVKFDDF